MAAVDELAGLRAERERLMSEGLAGDAVIVAIARDVAESTVGRWHEMTLDVRVPGRDPYRATRRIAVELSTAPHLAVGARVPVLVDPNDRSTVLIVSTP
jgi:hypothetical protein